MAKGADLVKLGSAQSAALSAMIGTLTLAFVNLGTEMSESFKDKVFALGKHCIPGAEGIGPYSGKELLMLAAWLLSWVILHFVLRRREWNHPTVVAVFLTGIGVATTLLWPPVTHLLASGH